MTAVYGWQGQLGIDTADPVTKRFDFVSCTLGVDEEFVDTGGLRGDLAHVIDRNRAGRRRVLGDIVLRPTPVELALLLPWINGAAAVGTSYPLGTSFTDRYVTVDKVQKVMTYNGCRVGRARFYATEGSPLELTLSVVGVDETVGNAATFPALSIDTTTSPFMFHECVLSVNATTTKAKALEVVIDYLLDAERFHMSQTITAPLPTDRVVTVNVDGVPYGDHSALYNTGPGGVAVTATYTNGLTSLLQSFVKVVFPRKPIAIPGREEIMLPLQGVAKKSGSTAELATTLDSDPAT